MAPPLRQRNLQVAKKELRKLNNKKYSPSSRLDYQGVTPNPADHGIVFPKGDTAFKALLSARFCAAIWSHITDCDETFNYWEP
ncbi:unnamed protein product, partial [Timema podura]|nr:unnamed protein product [Timema podura]